MKLKSLQIIIKLTTTLILISSINFSTLLRAQEADHQISKSDTLLQLAGLSGETLKLVLQVEFYTDVRNATIVRWWRPTIAASIHSVGQYLSRSQDQRLEARFLRKLGFKSNRKVMLLFWRGFLGLQPKLAGAQLDYINERLRALNHTLPKLPVVEVISIDGESALPISLDFMLSELNRLHLREQLQASGSNVNQLLRSTTARLTTPLDVGGLKYIVPVSVALYRSSLFELNTQLSVLSECLRLIHVTH